MRLAVAITMAVALCGCGTAWADGPNCHEDPFMKGPVKATAYASEHHMGFSWRSSIITWLGGVTIVDERDSTSADREKWWGDTVPLLSAEAIKVPDR